MLSIHSTSVELEGVHTDIMIQGFADRILVLVTQMGKVGNLIQASIPLTTPLLSAQEDSLFPVPSAAIQLTPLLGGASSEHLQTLHSLYAAQIATIIWVEEAKKMAVDRRSVVVGIALRDADERKIFHGVMDYIGRLIRE
ncbi:hypothetical protein CY34DRAFT_797138 [Suillus luteus UH-Slu-Lm8-n1]|uniref:Unplaced genomic scaffold CY34scaffold_2, whole genome shotgun sequence n=1 Tax=Suillus luteus UH-Slu-Lm8-n1 TaxID=930992 RepID=A0A0D0BHX0_9AGAM|nr:hypothetical protein CY34DRAFT_797138 [Suillus luteus UH-Slu-Lm8-n1]